MLSTNSAAQFVKQDWTCKLSSSWCVFWRNRLQYLSVSYKAWFQCGGYVNCQNYRYQSTENPGLIHKVLLHDVKNGVQYAESNWRIMGPIFFFWNHKFTLICYTYCDTISLHMSIYNRYCAFCSTTVQQLKP